MAEARAFSDEEKKRAAAERVGTWRRQQKKKGMRFVGLWMDYRGKSDIDELAWRRGQTPGEAVLDAVRALSAQMDGGSGGTIRLEAQAQRRLEDTIEERIVQRLASAGTVAPQVRSTPSVAPPPRTSPPRQSAGATPAPDGVKYILGKLCRKAHEYAQSGQSLLYAKSRGCYVCNLERKRKPQ